MDFFARFVFWYCVIGVVITLIFIIKEWNYIDFNTYDAIFYIIEWPIVLVVEICGTLLDFIERWKEK